MTLLEFLTDRLTPIRAVQHGCGRVRPTNISEPPPRKPDLLYGAPVKLTPRDFRPAAENRTEGTNGANGKAAMPSSSISTGVVHRWLSDERARTAEALAGVVRERNLRMYWQLRAEKAEAALASTTAALRSSEEARLDVIGGQ